MRYAVIRRWKDNERDFQVIEYYSTIAECKTYIKQQKRSNLFKYEIAKYI